VTNHFLIELKLYKNTPNNGLILFVGVIMLEDGKSEKKLVIDMEPFIPQVQFVYKCQNRFHTEPLEAFLKDDERFGFIIVDGNGVLYATLQGNNKEVLQRLPVMLPKKHGRGGQSAVRFARIREEKRHNYVRKVAELATQHFIENGERPNVSGLIIAGSANLKNDLQQSELFDKRLSNIVLASLDLAYGMDQGLQNAITMSADILAGVKFVQEKKLCGKFYEEIALDTGMICFGVDDTMKAMELGALEKMLLFENLEVNRYELKNPVTGAIKVSLLNPKQEQDTKYFKDAATGADLETISCEPLVDWLCINYKNFGVDISFITDKSPDGFQFCKGFGGIGGFLRYKLELDDIKHDATGKDNDDFDPDEDFI